MFRGITQLSLDSKGRLAIPTKYRDEFATSCAGNIVVTADPSRCLLIYPRPAWEPIEQKLNSLSGFDPRIRGLQRLLIGNACDVEMDGSGRILINPPLRQFAELTKEVVLAGQGTKLELWDSDRWNQEIEAALACKNGDIPPELEGFSL
ncbi:MAG: division/cell wall cluster transcriptional repressor MraZ [Nitrosomonas sp.]|nr:division/cell wall cluster transcriptional repressor MraZ [Nitrosomonas sp.]